MILLFIRCGPGGHSLEFASSEVQVFAIDNNENMIIYCQLLKKVEGLENEQIQFI